jgi:hypothetical protein
MSYFPDDGFLLRPKHFALIARIAVIARRYMDPIMIIVQMDISFITMLYIPVSFHFVLSFIRLLDLCRTKPLLVIFD